jgi:zinc and cadmium transporter
MQAVSFYIFISVCLVSLISLIGASGFLLNAERLRQFIFVAVSFAAGAMLGDAFIHLIPESFERLANKKATSIYVLAGFFMFFVLEKFLRWQHKHTGADDGHALEPVGYLNLFADGVHNYLDGLLIGASYLINVPIGITTTIAVLLHEIPQEIGDLGVLIHVGFSKRRALLFNFLSALLAVLGAITALILGEISQAFAAVMLPVTAGGFIYIAGSDLVPELQKENSLSKSAVQFTGLAAGAALMLAIA